MKASEIRKEAREALAGKWGKAVSIALVYFSITILISFIEGLAGEKTTLYNIIEVIYFIISIPLSFGLTISFIKLKRGEEVSAFSFFKEGFVRFFKSFGIWIFNLYKLLLPITTFISTTLFMILVCMVAIYYSSNYLIAIAAVILSIVTLAWFLSKSFLYALAYYISYDNPELSSRKCINKSAEIMKGNRKKYFYLQLSFIGWAFLSLFTLEIGMLWLMPYMQVAIVCFYEKIANK